MLEASTVKRELDPAIKELEKVSGIISLPNEVEIGSGPLCESYLEIVSMNISNSMYLGRLLNCAAELLLIIVSSSSDACRA